LNLPVAPIRITSCRRPSEKKLVKSFRKNLAEPFRPWFVAVKYFYCPDGAALFWAFFTSVDTGGKNDFLSNFKVDFKGLHNCGRKT
jgi:hypothetical protein